MDNVAKITHKRSTLVCFMSMAFTLARESKSKRRKCGSLLVRVDPRGIPFISSTGINGTEPGESNECEPPCLSRTYDHVIHAEMNCLEGAEVGTFDGNDILFITDSPCSDCLGEINRLGISTVVYCRKYRLSDHLDEYPDIQFIHVSESEVKAYLSESANTIEEVINTHGDD